MKQSSNIIFVNPPNAPFTSTGILIEPIDLLGLASWSNHIGHEATIIDMDVKSLLATDLNTYLNGNWPKYMVIVFDYHIPLHNGGAVLQISKICEEAKLHGCTTILGGKAATFWGEDKLQAIGADIFVAHEMEYVLKELFELPELTSAFLATVNGISYLNNNQISKNPSRKDKVTLEELPISNRNLVTLSEYIDVRTLLSSRGCNLQCTFCHVPGFWGFWRGRSANIVAKEIEHLVKEHGAKKILFLDDNATVKPKRMQEIAKILQQNKVEVALGCLGTIDRYDKEALIDMYKGGFRWIHYGAESGDDEQLSTMGKRINSQDIMEVVKATQECGLRVRTSWIMDMPGLTLEGLKKTEDLILTQGSEEIRLHFLTLRLGSILHNQNKSIDTEQFIHNPSQNLNISGVSEQDIENSVERILTGLISQGYTVVRHAHEFKDIEALQHLNPQLKIVSLCPLRYGLGWKY
jgi:anaerobic magnesium-protoporphyrin IX monomethyl ester cyclase